ncbi:MAG: hypothetical protein QM763_20560 [Agriterribacter sp.]
MKKLSTWGFYHPRLARRLMVLMKITMILLAWYIARLLRLTDVRFSADSFYAIAACMALGIILYPDSRKKKVYFNYRYYVHQKLCDAILTFSSFSAFIVFFNTNLLFRPAYGVEPVYRNSNPGAAYPVNPLPPDKGKISAKQSKAEKKSFFKQLKRLPVSAKKGNKKHAGLIIEMVLAITLGALLGMTVVGLACSLACSGNELGAVLIIIFGAGGIITGLIAWLRSIRRRKRKLMEMRENTEM